MHLYMCLCGCIQWCRAKFITEGAHLELAGLCCSCCHLLLLFSFVAAAVVVVAAVSYVLIFT